MSSPFGDMLFVKLIGYETQHWVCCFWISWESLCCRSVSKAIYAWTSATCLKLQAIHILWLLSTYFEGLLKDQTLLQGQLLAVQGPQQFSKCPKSPQDHLSLLPSAACLSCLWKSFWWIQMMGLEDPWAVGAVKNSVKVVGMIYVPEPHNFSFPWS